MKLTALTPIRHDGKRYAEGETFEVENKAQAAALVACGAAAEGGRSRSKAPAKPSAEQIEAATAAVTAAQAELDAAADDDAKAAAQQKLDEATAALEALKG